MGGGREGKPGEIGGEEVGMMAFFSVRCMISLRE
jgi:hypothetical protein